MTIRIDPASAHQIHLILAKCRTRGTDPVQALDAAGLLRYPARQEVERQELLRLTAAAIDVMTPTMLGGGVVPATAADMKRFIIDAIHRMAD